MEGAKTIFILVLQVYFRLAHLRSGCRCVLHKRVLLSGFTLM